MDLNYTAEDVAFRKQVRTWLEHNMPRHIKNLDERRAWHRRLYEAGYLGMGWPKEYGGQGARPMEQAIVADEMARAGAPAPTNGLGLGIAGPTIVVHGTDAQKRRYLRKILTAEEMWCQLYSEPNAGSDLAALRTAAVDKGNHFIVDGQKIWTSGGANADWGLLLARTDPAVPKHKGITCFLMNMRQPGVDVRPLKQITGESEFNEIFFEDVRVPKANLLGPLNQGWQVLVSTLMHERFGIGETIGGTEQTLAQLVEIARGAIIDGRSAAEDAEIRQQLAQFAIEVAAKKYNGLRSLTRRLKGRLPGPESSIGKLVSTELTQRMVKFSVRLLGEFALLERRSPFAPDGDWLRRILYSESMTIAGGTSPVQKNMIGERILQLPKG